MYRLFREAILLASQYNQAIAIPFFHSHYNGEKAGHKIMHPYSLPDFKNNWYTADIFYDPESTINTELLSRKVGLIDSKSYEKYCHHQIFTLIKCGSITSRQEEGLSLYLRTTKLQIAKIIEINHIGEYNSIMQYYKHDSNLCFSIAFGSQCFENRHAMISDVKGSPVKSSSELWLDNYKAISSYVRRPLLLTTIASEFIREIFQNRPFLAIHWRYDDAWLELCERKRDKYAREKNRAICNYIFGLKYDMNVEKTWTTKLNKLVKIYQVDNIYIATPPSNTGVIELIRDKNKRLNVKQGY